MSILSIDMKDVLFNQTDAARMLGISRGTLKRRIDAREIKEHFQRPSRISQTEIERHGGVVVAPEVQMPLTNDELLSTDVTCGTIIIAWPMGERMNITHIERRPRHGKVWRDGSAEPIGCI